MLQLTLLCDGAFRVADASMTCSFAVYYGSPLCGLLLKHEKRAQVVNARGRKATSTEAEFAAALSGLICIRNSGWETKKPIVVWSDCKAVVDKINSLKQDMVTARHCPNWFVKHESIIGH